MAKRARKTELQMTVSARDQVAFGNEELISVVANLMCQGRSVAEVIDIIEEKYKVRIGREIPYRLFAHAAQKGWIRFTGPIAVDLSEKLKSQFPFLHDVRVVRTAVSEDISQHASGMLLKMIQKLIEENPGKKEVHIGFAGGSTLRRLAGYFAQELQNPIETGRLPNKIVFHAMVADFNSEEPTNNPNAFFTYFVSDQPSRVKTGFVGLHAPGLVSPDQMEMILKFDDIKNAYAQVDDIDIIVTSAGGHWKEGHSALYDMYKQASPSSLTQINKHNPLGDLMWRPFGKGPIEIATKIRTMTLMDLSDLPGFITKKDKRVLLLIGPCGSCGGPKMEILKAILSYRPQLITHVIVDSRSAQGALNDGLTNLTPL